MTFKKMLLLASMALAAVAFSAPTSASAQEWTQRSILH
jgi:polyisoprenoid-binding protein YceI